MVNQLTQPATPAAWVQSVNTGRLEPNPAKGGVTGRPGAYLRVLRAGPVSAGDRVKVAHRPGHGVTISMALFALTLRPGMLGDLLAAGADLPDEMRRQIKERMG